MLGKALASSTLAGMFLTAVGAGAAAVTFQDTGHLSSLSFPVESWPLPGTGCSPGFWKTHLGPWTLTGYSPEWTVQDVFEVPDEYGLDTDTLLAALDY